MQNPKQDLELAKLRLLNEDLSIVIVKNGKVIFETKKQGITGFLQAIEKLDKDLISSSIADKIVGVAAAILCVFAGTSSVFAKTISESGITKLQSNKILFEFEKKVSNILNRGKTDVCPFEKLAMSALDPEDGYQKLKSFSNRMAKNSEAEC